MGPSVQAGESGCRLQDHAEQVFAEVSTAIAQGVGPAIDAVLELPEAEVEAIASLTKQVGSPCLIAMRYWLCSAIAQSRSVWRANSDKQTLSMQQSAHGKFDSGAADAAAAAVAVQLPAVRTEPSVTRPCKST